MKILQIVESLHNGAVENWLVNCFVEISKIKPDWQWTFFCIIENQGKLERLVKDNGGKVLKSQVTISDKKKFIEHRFYELLSHKIPERILHDYFIKNIDDFYKAKKIVYMSIKQRVDIFKELNNVLQFKTAFLPSGGLCTLMYVIDTFRDYSIWITGFDSFRTKYYWRSVDEGFKVHSSLHEALFLKQLVRRNIINLL